MKKFLTVLVVALATAAAAHAQFGIVGGYTNSKTGLDASLLDIKSMSQFHAGIAYKIGLGSFFALQPSLTYEVKGVNLQGGQNFDPAVLNSGFVELGVGAQLGLDLLAFRPFLVAQPFVGYQVYGGELKDDVSKTLAEVRNKLEYGFGVGAGVELLRHIQLSFQWFMNLGNLYNRGQLDAAQVSQTVKDNYKDIKNYQGIKVSLGLFF